MNLKCLTLDCDQLELRFETSKMEEVCRRFPLLAEKVLSKVDYQSLVKCKEVSKKMNEFLNTGKFLWKQMIIKRITGNLYFQSLCSLLS